jgi:hypothetical protein
MVYPTAANILTVGMPTGLKPATLSLTSPVSDTIPARMVSRLLPNVKLDCTSMFKLERARLTYRLAAATLFAKEKQMETI